MDKGHNRLLIKDVDQQCSPLVKCLIFVAQTYDYHPKLVESWKCNNPCGNDSIGIVCSNGQKYLKKIKGLNYDFTNLKD